MKKKTKDPFVLHIENEMKWNQAKVTEVNRNNVNSIRTVQWHTDLLLDEWTRAFYYNCLAGSSVKKQISTAVKQYFELIKGDIKFKVVADTSNSRHDTEHNYLIIFLK